MYRDSWIFFSFFEGVKFEGNLDEDSDVEIDKMVDKLIVIKEVLFFEIVEEKKNMMVDW